MNCSLCDRVQALKEGMYPLLVKEFKHSYLLLGDHQYYPGYCVLLSKIHYREMTDLPAAVQAEFFHEMMIAHRIIEKTYQPKKMNMCSLGNVVDHVHWHFFPRYESDPHFKNPPFLQMNLFETAKTTPEMAREAIERLRLTEKNLSSSVR